MALEQDSGEYRPGRMVRASQLAEYRQVENGDWKYLVFDKNTDRPRMPQGSVGFCWQSQKGQWNLEMKDGLDGAEIEPLLTFLANNDGSLPVRFTEFAGERVFKRGVPVKYMETETGEKLPVVTIYDLLDYRLA